MAIMNVLTVHQPWAWAIFHAGKDIENRSRSTSLRGELAIHAGRHVNQEAIERLRAAGHPVPDAAELPTRVILGTVLVLGCSRDSTSVWARPGAWHWRIGSPLALPVPVPHRGRPGMHSQALIPPRKTR